MNTERMLKIFRDEQKMDSLTGLLIIAIYFLLQLVVLPKLGVPT
jgi:hypothetical protein